MRDRQQSFVHSTDPEQSILTADQGIFDVSTIVIYNPNSADVPFTIQLRGRGPDDREMLTTLVDDSVPATDTWERSMSKPWHLKAHVSDPTRHDRIELVPDAAPTEPVHVTVFYERTF